MQRGLCWVHLGTHRGAWRGNGRWEIPHNALPWHRGGWKPKLWTQRKGQLSLGYWEGCSGGVADPVSRADTTLDGSTPEHGSTPF